jgi:hypothetical protein
MEPALADRRDLLLRYRELPEDLQFSPELLREILRDLGLTRTDAAALLGQTKSTIDKWMMPAGSPHLRTPPYASWTLLLLLTDRHPWLRLEPTVAGEALVEREQRRRP